LAIDWKWLLQLTEKRKGSVYLVRAIFFGDILVFDASGFRMVVIAKRVLIAHWMRRLMWVRDAGA
jgi:hypothetical protein